LRHADAINNKQQTTTTMTYTVAELNKMAQDLANKIGHIRIELLQEVYTLAHSEDETTETDA